MDKIERLTLGGLGGVCAVMVKFLGQDYTSIVAHAANLTADQILAYKVGYGILTPILMFLGAFVAWVSDENKRVKVVALAIAAPAVITTWSGGHSNWGETPGGGARFSYSFISSAYADAFDTPTPGLKPEEPDRVTSKSVPARIGEGVAIFFGYGNKPVVFSVIAGSFGDKGEAFRYAAQISAMSSFHAWVGETSGPDSRYAVVIGERGSLSEVHTLRSKTLATGRLQDAYFSSAELHEAHAG